jgi:hypothetical protein
MKEKPIRFQTTLKGEAHAIAFILSILGPFAGTYACGRILKAVAACCNYEVRAL